MRFERMACAALIVTSLMSDAVFAQSLRDVRVPAEFPPASYKGTQYVDSLGCVYIRAGVDGVTTWVPRVSRNRRPVCDQTPTQVAGTTLTAPLAPGVEQITLDMAAPVAEEPAAEVTPKPAPTPVLAARKTASRPKPQATQSPQTVLSPVARPVDVGAGGGRGRACPDASPIGRQYIKRGRDGLEVRCGPQEVRHAARPARSTSAAPSVSEASAPMTARGVPAHVAAARKDGQSFRVPEGYRPAWTDDRLNSRRAEGTQAGWQQMQLIWSNTVPRRLIDTRSGRDVTATVPLVYPYTDASTQQAELGTVTLASMGGKVVKRITRRTAVPSSSVTPSATRSGEPLSGKRYVQVASFGVRSNAQATARKLAQAGLPMRIGKLTREGKTYRLVLAGPFADDAAALNALRIARNAGFGDAYIRK